MAFGYGADIFLEDDLLNRCAAEELGEPAPMLPSEMTSASVEFGA